MSQQLGKQMIWEKKPTIGDAPSIRHEELHLWDVPLKLDEDQSASALQLLNEKQRIKYEKRRTAEQKELYLAGRYCLFSLLSAYTKVNPQDLNLGYSRLNKPFLIDNPIELYFNYTDTYADNNGRGLFAFCLGREVGVDIEARGRHSDFKQISDRRYSDAEREYVTEQNGQLNAERCLAIWTRKEAYGKATGKGINFTMREYDFAPKEHPYELNFTDHSNGQWRLNQLEIDRQFVACVVHQGHQPLSIRPFRL